MGVEMHEKMYQLASQIWLFLLGYIPYLSKTHDDTSQKLAVCIDLDGTIWTEGSQHCRIFTWVKDTLQELLRRKYLIYFVTARREKMRAETVRALGRLLPETQYILYMRSDDDKRPIAMYKADARQKITRDCVLALCVGNTLADMYKEKEDTCYNILIPNVLHRRLV